MKCSIETTRGTKLIVVPTLDNGSVALTTNIISAERMVERRCAPITMEVFAPS